MLKCSKFDNFFSIINQLGGGEIMKKKMIISGLTILVALGMLTLSVSAAVAVHAQMEGLAIVKSGSGRPDICRNAVMTFYQVTDGYHGFTEPGWAVTLQMGSTLYVWHVTDIKTCGRSSIVIMKAEPHGAVLPGSTSGPTNIRIILNHNPDRPFVVATGRGVLFVGRTVVPT
jgi:hypothetical protein